MQPASEQHEKIIHLFSSVLVMIKRLVGSDIVIRSICKATNFESKSSDFYFRSSYYCVTDKSSIHLILKIVLGLAGVLTFTDGGYIGARAPLPLHLHLPTKTLFGIP